MLFASVLSSKRRCYDQSSLTKQTRTAIASPNLVVPSKITDSSLPDISSFSFSCSSLRINGTKSNIRRLSVSRYACSSRISLKQSILLKGTPEKLSLLSLCKPFDLLVESHHKDETHHALPALVQYHVPAPHFFSAFFRICMFLWISGGSSKH